MARYRAWVGIFCFLLAAESIAAFVYRVGGNKGWVVPKGIEPDTYNHWAGSHRFQIGDSFLFKYARGNDSVLVVTKQAYSTCNTSNPIVSSDNGDSLFRFDVSGPFYFISGVVGNCLKGQKLVVVVMAQRDSSVGWHSPDTPLPQAPSATVDHSPVIVLSPAASPGYRVPLTTGAAFSVSSSRGFVFIIFSALAFTLLFL